MRSFLLLLVCAAAACAQDPFEIQVFEYEPLPRGASTYEAHLNYVLDGSRAFSGPVAPTEDQFHFTSEWTVGLAQQLRMGFALLTSARPGQPLEYAGFRVLPHFYTPRSWHLPVNLGVVAEFSSVRPLYDENTQELELRGIVEKHIGRLQLDGNLVFARALHGPGTRSGWSMEPAGRMAWQVYPRLTPSLEYYSALGPLGSFLPGNQQVHLFLPSADWQVTGRLKWSFGVGVSATASGNHVILKSRFEYEFGRKHD